MELTPAVKCLSTLYRVILKYQVVLNILFIQFRRYEEISYFINN